MYLKVFDDPSIPGTETLSLSYLPDRVPCRWYIMTANQTKLPDYLPHQVCNDKVERISHRNNLPSEVLW